MRPIRSLLLYALAVFVGGALLAPLLYGMAQAAAARWPACASLAASPFHRFMDRALLGAALIGLWPLLHSCKMASAREMGFAPRTGALSAIFRGFCLGFGSLASVALLAIAFHGRLPNLQHSGADLAGYIIKATLASAIVAVLEEILFRGALFGILRKAQPGRIALIFSSVIYAAAHFIQKAEAPGPIVWSSGLALLPKMFDKAPPFIPGFFVLFMAGTILALAYQRTGTLFFSIGLHAGWIFWLKSYGFFTRPASGASTALWGSDRLIDGWLALPILVLVFYIVSRLRPLRAAS